MTIMSLGELYFCDDTPLMSICTTCEKYDYQLRMFCVCDVY